MRIATSLLLLASLAAAGGADVAKALLKKGDAKGAATAARKAAETDPADIDAWLVLADALFAEDAPADAWEALEAAIGKNPDEPRLSLKLGDAFVRIAEQEQRNGSDGMTITNYYLDAERNYGEALRKDPKCADALYGMANVNFAIGTDEKRDAAKSLAAQCLALDANHAKAHALQGYMFLLAGQDLARQRKEDEAKEKYRAAQEKYEVALKLGGLDVLDHVRYGHTLFGQGKYEEAKKAYLAGLKQHPGSPIPIQSGLYHIANQGKPKASWANMKGILEEAVKEAPASAPAWYYLGYCHFIAEDWSKALDAYGKAAHLDPGNATYTFNVGYAHEKMGDEAKALDLYRKTLTAFPDHPDATDRFYALILAKAQDLDRAEKLFEELLKLSPNNANFANDYALILRNAAEATRTHLQDSPPAEVKRRLKRSGEVYEIAAALAPDSAQVQSDTGLLFWFYPCNFDGEKAKRYLKRSLDLSDFAYLDAFNGLDQLCRKIGDWETLADYAERVVGSMERGNMPLSPVGGGAPEARPAERAGMKARAEAALKLAESKLKSKG
jgi:tetratricopeptide (TPR) repeat protein